MFEFWSNHSSTSILHVCEQRRLWRDCVDVISAIISWAGSMYKSDERVQRMWTVGWLLLESVVFLHCSCLLVLFQHYGLVTLISTSIFWIFNCIAKSATSAVNVCGTDIKVSKRIGWSKWEESEWLRKCINDWCQSTLAQWSHPRWPQCALYGKTL